MSSLTVTKFKPAVNSMGDLAASQDLTLTLSANSVFSQYILVDELISISRTMVDNLRVYFVLTNRTVHRPPTNELGMQFVVIQPAFT